MRVFIPPTPGTLASTSNAMRRVSEALTRYAPVDFEFALTPEEADLQVLHVIGAGSIRELRAPEFVAIQYCYETAGEADWRGFWNRSRGVWSYYNLPTEKLYLSPLGVDSQAFIFNESEPRPTTAMTSGFVSGPTAEAIEEVAEAALRMNGSVFHLGPAAVVGMHTRSEWGWRSDVGIPESQLVYRYQRAKWVSGLRHVEGFEFPVIEGFACGARPIVFDRPEMRRWYRDFAVFVPECTGEELVRQLVRLFQIGPTPVTLVERARVLPRFDWKKLVEGFWREVLR